MPIFHNFRWQSGDLGWMRVEEGRVQERGEGTIEGGEIDLAGDWLLPGFIDAHCHILPTGLDLQKLHLGRCSTPEEVLDAVRDRHQELPPEQWLHAVHYDQTKFPTGEHLHRDALDAITGDRPIVLRHSNGHASVANSAALRAAGVDERTPDPKGGTFVRDASGRLTGVLLERAHEHVSEAGPSVDLDGMVNAILAAGQKMSALGITCASDMMTGRFDLDLELQAYRIAAEKGCKIRTRLYLQWATVFGPRAVSPDRLAELSSALDPDTCKIAGIKIFADGAIGSATAAIYGRFTGSPEGTEEDGQLIYRPDRLNQMVRTAHDAGYSIAIHSIGDRATDLVMNAYEAVGEAHRHRIEHVMMLSDSQIERLKSLGVHCTMQPEFLVRFAHGYRRQLGEPRASRLKRARSVMEAGIPLSFNSDRPIVPGNPWDGITAAVRRPDGYDPSEEIGFCEALEAYTAMGAVANQDSERMGSLKVGQVADFQVYEDEPIVGPSNPQPSKVFLAGRECNPRP
jgi:predicted amidohydrolase YtcJ